MTVIAAIKSY